MMRTKLEDNATEFVEANDDVCSALVGWLYMQHLPPLDAYRDKEVQG